MTVKGYIRDGSTLVEDSSGFSETQIWNVPVQGVDGGAFLWAASANNAPPKLGDPHPRDPSLSVLSRQISDIGGGIARIVVNYGVRGTVSDTAETINTITDVRFDGAVSTEKRKFDIAGNPIISGVSAYSVAVTVSTTIIEVDRIEAAPPTAAFISQFKDRVNSSPVNGFPSRTLLMYSPRSRVIDATGNFTVTYVFAADLSGWDRVLEVITIDTEQAQSSSSGLASAAVTTTVVKGVQTERTAYRVYEEADFNQIGLIF